MAPTRFLAWLAGAALLAGAAAAAPRQGRDPVLLEWKSTVHRLGGDAPLRVGTREESLVAELHSSAIVVKCSDGKERRLRSSARESKPQIVGGQHVIEVDVAELADAPPAGKFEVCFERKDGSRTKPLQGTFVAPAADPAALLREKPDRVAALLETDEGNLLVELDATKAPKTVANFVKLAAAGFYDGKVFHRIVRGFVIQGGGVRPDGSQAESEKIPFEATGLPHERGAISMARLPADPNSATCQFFLCLVNARQQLDGKYAAFGKVVSGCGFEAMDRIALRPVKVGSDNEKSRPLEPPVIRKVTIVEKP